MAFWFGLAGWIGCAVFVYGAALHYFQTKYSLIADESLRDDRVVCAIIALFGPAALASFFIVRGMSRWADGEAPPRIGWRW